MPPSENDNKVSIIVVNRNGKKFLQDSLESLYHQTYTEREIILVDNDSTDGSVGLVRERFPHVKIVELSENRGFAGGNSAGLSAATGQFVALMNNDACADRRWLECLIRPMVEDSKIGICASKLLEGRPQASVYEGCGLTTAGVGFDRSAAEDVACYDFPVSVFGGCGAAVLYRRKVFDEIGFLDEEFFLYDEDTDLNFRAQLAGWKCAYVPDAFVFHKANATAGRLSETHVYYHTRNLEFVWVKNMPAGLMIRFAHHKLIQEIGAFVYLCLRHMKWRAFFRAKRDALRMMPAMWKKRAEIQKRRRVSNRYIREIVTSVFSVELIQQKARQLLWG